MKTKLGAIMLIVLMIFGMSASAAETVQLMSDRVVSVTPENGAAFVDSTDCEMVVTYASDVTAAEKTVLVNGESGYTDTVAAEGSALKIKFKNLKEGTRYKVEINGTDGNDITTFFTTNFVDINYVAKYQQGNFDKFYGKSSIGTSFLSADYFSFTTNSTTRKNGCRVTSQDMELDTRDITKIIIGLTSENPVTMKLYFSYQGANKGFDNKTGAVLSGGMLSGTLAAADAEIHTNALTPFAAKDYGSIALKYQNATPSSTAQLYFACDGSGGKYSEDYKFEIDVIPNDDRVREYVIATGSSKSWLGNISGIKLVFGASSGSFAIDEIGFYKYPYTVSTPNDTLTVEGVLSPNDTVNIQTVKSDYEDFLDEIEQNGSYIEAVLYTDDVKTDENGSFKFEYPLTPSLEPQGIVVMLADSASAYTSRVSYIDNGYPQRAREAINRAIENKNPDSIYSEITKAYQYLGIESAGYYDFIGKYTNKTDFANQMIKTGTAADLTELETKISHAAVYAVIKACANDALADNAKKYDAVLALSSCPSYSIYSSLLTYLKTSLTLSRLHSQAV